MDAKDLVKFSKILHEDRGSDFWNYKVKKNLLLCTIVSKNPQAHKMVKLLLDNGANVDMLNDKDVNGETVIMVAAGSKNEQVPEIMKMLLRAGADVNVVDKSNWTPLMFAAESQNANASKIVKLLLKAGAGTNINQSNVNNYTALMLAAGSENEQALPIVAQLARISDIDMHASNRCGYTALFCAAMLRNRTAASMVERLLKAGADPNVMVHDTVVLDFAIKQANLKMVKVLLDHGANPDVLSWQAAKLIEVYQGEKYYKLQDIGAVRHEIALAILDKRGVKLTIDDSKDDSKRKDESDHKRRRRG